MLDYCPALKAEVAQSVLQRCDTLRELRLSEGRAGCNVPDCSRCSIVRIVATAKD